MRSLLFGTAMIAAITAVSARGQVRIIQSSEWVTAADLQTLGVSGDLRFGLRVTPSDDGTIGNCEVTVRPKKLATEICAIVKTRAKYLPFAKIEGRNPIDFVGYYYSDKLLSIAADYGGSVLLNWFVDTDLYPLEAIRRGERGLARAKFRVGSDKRAHDCVIVESSKSESLDAMTCQQVLSNFRALPPVGPDGQPVEVPAIISVQWQLSTPPGDTGASR